MEPVDSSGDHLLLTSLELGDFKFALRLLPKDGPPITIGPKGITPLHYACHRGDAEVTRLLITQYNYCIESSSKSGQTPAHLAAQNGHIDALKVLVELSKVVDPSRVNTPQGETVNPSTQIGFSTASLIGIGKGRHVVSCSSQSGMTPLHLAALHGHLHVVKYLVDEVGCPKSPIDEQGRSPLYLAAGSGQLEVVRYFTLEKKCDPNTGTTRQWSTAAFSVAPGRTPLHTASAAGQWNVVCFLVDCLKCEPSCIDYHGVTPLSLAAENGRLAVVQFLVESGCDPMVREVDGRTPPHYASQNGHLDTVWYLASTGAVDLSCRDNNGVTPLSLAAANGYLQVVQFLVESRCDPMVKETDGRTPLHYASQNGHLDTVKYFASTEGVDLSCQDKDGVTPLLLAAECGYLPIVQFLVESGCDPMIRQVEGRTPLHQASQNGHLELVKYFASISKVDLSCQDESGITPVQLAEDHNQWAIVLYFRSMGYSIKSTPSHILDMFDPLSLFNNVYVVGNRSSGKSSLVKALSAKHSWLGGFLNVRGVVPDTAGVLPSEFNSKEYGRVTFYDFAGHPEYYSGHEAVFENASHAVVVIVVDLSIENHSISRALRYWRLLLHSSISTAGSQAHVIVVGSHADIVPPQDLSTKASLLEQFNSSSVLSVVGKCVLDCRKSASKGMSDLHAFLKKSCKAVCAHLDFDSQYGNILNEFLRVSLSEKAACTFSDLSFFILEIAIREPKLVSLTLPDLLYQTCESLNTSGHILFLKNTNNLEESWIVLKKGTILSEVNGILKHLKEHASLGIVPLPQLLSVLDEHVHDLAPDLVIRYMTSMLFCSKVDSHALRHLTDFHANTANSEETYLFFPSLVSVQMPTQVWLPTNRFTYATGWQLKCTDPDSFFTPRFLQTLQMELASKFALKVPSSLPGILELKKGCRLWLNGIRWINDGIEVVMYVGNDNAMLGLMLRCVDSQEMECVRLRSELIRSVFKIKSNILNTMQTSEYLVHPYYTQELAVPEAASLLLADIATAIVQKAKSICLDDPTLEGAPGYPILLIQDLLHFEPFEGMGFRLLKELFDQLNSFEVIKPSTLRNLAGALQVNWKLVAVALNTPIDVVSAVEAKNTSEFDKCLSILKEWAHREGTYSALCRDLGQYTIFCGRNPLDTPGITLPRIPEVVDNQPSDLDNLIEEKRALLQGTPTLHQLLCMYPDGDRSQRAVRTLAVVAHKWEVVAFCLEFEDHIVQTIARNNTGDCEGACRDMFGRWLEGSFRKPVTWETLIRALREADENSNALADQLVEILCHLPKNVPEASPEGKVKDVPGIDVSVHTEEFVPDDLSQDSQHGDVSGYNEGAVEYGENIQ